MQNYCTSFNSAGDKIAELFCFAVRIHKMALGDKTSLMSSEAKSMGLVSIHEKTEEIWLSLMTKAPTPTENPKKQRDNTHTPPKASIKQRLRTDLGRSVVVTIATHVVKPVYGIQTFRKTAKAV